mmetsp:Transcript_17953/g.27291  ORF Transcript_17953/g.27291 Transcript_17953/m.27291 type:complete len:610 (-) Transcript_17953:197-2026(-)
MDGLRLLYWIGAAIAGLQASLFVYRLAFSETRRRVHRKNFLIIVERLLKADMIDVVRLASKSAFDLLNHIYGTPRDNKNFLTYFTSRSFRVSFIIAFCYLVLFPLGPSLALISGAIIFPSVEGAGLIIRGIGYLGFTVSVLGILYLLALSVRLLIKNIKHEYEMTWYQKIIESERVFLALPTHFVIVAAIPVIIFAMLPEATRESLLEVSLFSVLAGANLIFFTLGFAVLATIGALRAIFRYGVATIFYLPAIVLLHSGRVIQYFLIAVLTILCVAMVKPGLRITDSPSALPLNEVVAESMNSLPFISSFESSYVPYLIALAALFGIGPIALMRLFRSHYPILVSRGLYASFILAISIVYRESPVLNIGNVFAHCLAIVSFVTANAFGDIISTSISRYIFWMISRARSIIVVPLHVFFDILGIVGSIISACALLWICTFSILQFAGMVEHIASPTFALSADELDDAPWLAYAYWGSSIALVGIPWSMLVSVGLTPAEAAFEIRFINEVFMSGVIFRPEGQVLLAMAAGVLASFFTSILPTILNFFVIFLFLCLWAAGGVGRRFAYVIGRFLVCNSVTETERSDRIETIYVGMFLAVLVFTLVAVGSAFQ